MSGEFTPLDSEEVVNLEYNSLCKELGLESYFAHLYLAVGQFTTAIKNRVNVSDETRNQLFKEDVNCKVLKFGANSWQKGKIRVKITVDFCPDEPEKIEEEEEEESQNGESENSDFDSLDDLRKELNH